MIPPDKLRALLADHPPQAYMSKDQEKIRDVWDAAREMLNVNSASIDTLRQMLEKNPNLPQHIRAAIGDGIKALATIGH